MARGNEGSSVTDADQQMLEKMVEGGHIREGIKKRRNSSGKKNDGRRGVAGELLE